MCFFSGLDNFESLIQLILLIPSKKSLCPLCLEKNHRLLVSRFWFMVRNYQKQEMDHSLKVV